VQQYLASLSRVSLFGHVKEALRERKRPCWNLKLQTARSIFLDDRRYEFKRSGQGASSTTRKQNTAWVVIYSWRQRYPSLLTRTWNRKLRKAIPRGFVPGLLLFYKRSVTNERREDIPLRLLNICSQIATEHGANPKQFDDKEFHSCKIMTWQNTWELRNGGTLIILGGVAISERKDVKLFASKSWK
jgi:hypothetical protein